MAGSCCSLPGDIRVATSSSSSSEFSRLNIEPKLASVDEIRSFSGIGDCNDPRNLSISIHESDSTPFCVNDNVAECLSYINQELVSLGIASLYDPVSETFAMPRLVNAAYGLLQRLRHGVRAREDLEDGLHKALSDLEHLRKEKKRLKSSVEQLKHDLSEEQIKMHNIVKVNSLIGTKLKAEKEEVKRLSLLLQNRDVQYKHSVRKVESEMSKLKERLRTSFIDKTDRKIGIDISEMLLRSDGKRAKWKTGCSNIEELYQNEMKNFEEKQKQLLLENHELRQGLKEIHKELSSVLIKTASESDSISEENLSEINASDNVCDGSFEMPFEIVGAAVMDKIRKQISSIEAKVMSSGSRSFDSKLKEAQSQEIAKLHKKVERYRSLVEHTQMLYKHNTSTERLLNTMSLVDMDFVEKAVKKTHRFGTGDQFLFDSANQFDDDHGEVLGANSHLDCLLEDRNDQEILVPKSIQVSKSRKIQEA